MKNDSGRVLQTSSKRKRNFFVPGNMPAEGGSDRKSKIDRFAQHKATSDPSLLREGKEGGWISKGGKTFGKTKKDSVENLRGNLLNVQRDKKKGSLVKPGRWRCPLREGDLYHREP